MEQDQIECTGRVINGVVIPQPGASLPEGGWVKITLETEAPEPERGEKESTLGERLMKFAGIAEGLPPDFSVNHDHYLHGTPKRQ